MAIQIREKTIEEIQGKLEEMNTELNQIAYLESALKGNLGLEIKRFVWVMLVDLYDKIKMYEKGAKAMASKAGIDISSKEKIESYLKSAELYAKAMKIENAEQMFVRALRISSPENKQKIRLARKNVFLINANDLEKKGKSLACVKFYEKLIEMPLEEFEEQEIRKKLEVLYNSLGKFRESKLISGNKKHKIN